MRTRFFNGVIVTMNEKNEIFNGEVWTTDDKIVYVGDSNAAENMHFDREVDLKGDCILPGFKNCHCHSPMTLFRSYADDLHLNDWLFKKIFPLEAKLTADDVYWGTLLAVLEYVSGGVTTISDMYFFDEALLKAMSDSGMRCVFVKGMTDLGNDTKSVLENCERLFNFYNEKNSLISYNIGIHAEYTASRSLLNGTKKLLDKYDAPFSIHLSESKKEVDECIEKYGHTPPFEVARHGLFDNGGVVYHCVHINREDMQMLKTKNVSIVINPASNLKLANGISPVCEMVENGLNVAIGTDGPASNNGLDMFREMYLATVLQKVVKDDASAMPAEDVLKMATVNGARALRLDDCDCIAVGKQADLLVLNLRMPNMQPHACIQKSIVFSGNKSNVRMTMIAGKIVFEEGKYNIGVDPQVVFDNCNRIVERLKNTKD